MGCGVGDQPNAKQILKKKIYIFQANYYITDIAEFCMKMADEAKLGSGTESENIWFGKDKKKQLNLLSLLTIPPVSILPNSLRLIAAVEDRT
jgi:hypothetical protein